MAPRKTQRASGARPAAKSAKRARPPRRAPLDAIFRPRSVAVVGASRRKQTIGREILRNIVDFGFTGPVYPVNPASAVVNSMKCYRRSRRSRGRSISPSSSCRARWLSMGLWALAMACGLWQASQSTVLPNMAYYLNRPIEDIFDMPTLVARAQQVPEMYILLRPDEFEEFQMRIAPAKVPTCIVSRHTLFEAKLRLVLEGKPWPEVYLAGAGSACGR